MHITNVSIRPTETALALERPCLTPELVAACGARYSRNNEGLKGILEKIDPHNVDKSVDSIFKMIDYGHQSIADMATVVMFIDEISILLAYLIWSWCPTASGQESSTRYIQLSEDGLVDPSLLGLKPEQHSEWAGFMKECFSAYSKATEYWASIAKENPSAVRIPKKLLDDPSDKAQLQVKRMSRNYAFDRARYFIPLAAKTNMMLVMSSRGWVQLCQNLLSHWLPEANQLGEALREELKVSAPRMVKHAIKTKSFVLEHKRELVDIQSTSQKVGAVDGEHVCKAKCDIWMPADADESQLVKGLANHDNRYAKMGVHLNRTAARFSWSAVSMAEIRDLNRHRTGSKYCPLIPVGFYFASDQMNPEWSSIDQSMIKVGVESANRSLSALKSLSNGFVSWQTLGCQFQFEHTTTLDKFVYEAELRTGSGAHFRYADHLRTAVASLQEKHGSLAQSISLGTNEPE